MEKSILNSLIIFVIFVILNYLITYISIRTIFNENTHLIFFDLLNYTVLVCLEVIFISIYSNGFNKIKKIRLKFIFQVLFIVVLFKIVEDPLFKINIITGKQEFPVIGEIATPLLDQIDSILFIVLIGPISEELLFRRIILNFFNKKYLFIGIIVSSLLFASIHINTTYSNYVSVISLFLFGVIACFIYIRKGLIYSILFHVSYNAIWMILDKNRVQYWSILQKLDFGIIYWIIVIISFVALIYIVTNNFKQILSKKE